MGWKLSSRIFPVVSRTVNEYVMRLVSVACHSPTTMAYKQSTDTTA